MDRDLLIVLTGGAGTPTPVIPKPAIPTSINLSEL
jgi:hypothetical protein